PPRWGGLVSLRQRGRRSTRSPQVRPAQLPEQRQLRGYHAGCFACRSCHCALAGQRYYQQEGRPLCAPCYQVGAFAGGRALPPGCGSRHSPWVGQPPPPHCLLSPPARLQNTLEKCGACRDLITDQIVWAMGHGYHPECFTCAACGRAMGDETFAVGDDHEVLCLDDFYRCGRRCWARLGGIGSGGSTRDRKARFTVDRALSIKKQN
uniref:LIM zinc-binding domain-containing protein n=1 Tax=Varanus komodoensis TaxID=61221 RepID=A0A8D2KWA6_VARKO